MPIEPTWSSETQQFGEGPFMKTHKVVVVVARQERGEAEFEGGPTHTVRKILRAACSCYHGVAGKCAHIAALLLIINSLPLPSSGGISSTSIRCRWAQRMANGSVIDENECHPIRMIRLDSARFGRGCASREPSDTAHFHVSAPKARKHLRDAIERTACSRNDRVGFAKGLKVLFPGMKSRRCPRVWGSRRVVTTPFLDAMVAEP